jgi:Uma2 family endonuclease
MKRATYEDVLNAPENKVAEILDGELFLSPRPAPAHALAHFSLGALIGNPFHHGIGGPGGWWILNEPELHLGENVLVPDLAGWRRERMAAMPHEAYFTLPPDWVCEVLSPSTTRIDRLRKLPIYAAAGVPFAWLVDPLERIVEALQLRDGAWSIVAAHGDTEVARLAPFGALALQIARLWADTSPAEAPPPAAEE